MVHDEHSSNKVFDLVHQYHLELVEEVGSSYFRFAFKEDLRFIHGILKRMFIPHCVMMCYFEEEEVYLDSSSISA